jgi:hypothetical protein
MVKMKDKLEEQKTRLERKVIRTKETIQDYEDRKDRLSIHGHWSLGYFVGILNRLEDELDFVNDLLDIYKEEEERE